MTIPNSNSQPQTKSTLIVSQLIPTPLIHLFFGRCVFLFEKTYLLGWKNFVLIRADSYRWDCFSAGSPSSCRLLLVLFQVSPARQLSQRGSGVTFHHLLGSLSATISARELPNLILSPIAVAVAITHADSLELNSLASSCRHAIFEWSGRQCCCCSSFNF